MQSLILLIFLFDLKNYTNVRNEEISFQVNVVIKFKGLIINKSIIKINHLKKFKIIRLKVNLFKPHLSILSQIKVKNKVNTFFY